MSRLSGVDNMKHLGLENDLTPPEHLVAMAKLWHYGWTWAGGQECMGPVCTYAPCGLIVQVNPGCHQHGCSKLGEAKQLHKAADCPGAR